MHESFQIIFDFNRERLVRNDEIQGHNTWMEISLMHVGACVPLHNPIWVLQPLIKFIVFSCLRALIVTRKPGVIVDNDSRLVRFINRFPN